MATEKILLVEDSSVQALRIKALLKEHGHNVLPSVGRAEEAIKKVAEEKPSLIIMDIFLNGDMTGIEAMQKIRQHSEVPVIYITANSDLYYKQKAKRIGYSDFLFKPIKDKKLLNAVQRALGRDKKNVFQKMFSEDSFFYTFFKPSAHKWA